MIYSKKYIASKISLMSNCYNTYNDCEKIDWKDKKIEISVTYDNAEESVM